MTMRGWPSFLDRSLNLRLLSFAGGAIATALVLAWAVLGMLFERHAERQLQVELERHGIAVIAALSLDAANQPRLGQKLSDPRFERPASGLYWRLTTPSGELRSRSLWDGDIPKLQQISSVGWSIANGKGPFESRIMIVTRQIKPDPDRPAVQVEVAADREPLASARRAFGRETAIFLGALWVMLGFAAWVQVKMGLRPLFGVRHELQAMTKASDARLDVKEHPREIRPLTEAINRVAQQRAEDIVKARYRARDLAHALKTPLTALRLQIDSLPPDSAKEMMHSLSLVSGAVEGELARTGSQNEVGKVAAAQIVARVLAVVRRTPAGSHLKIQNNVPPDLEVPMSEESLIETLGAVIENAVRHARDRLEICGGVDSDARWLSVADDGPGIEQKLRDMALERGKRLDEQGTSYGLGLSIAQDFLRASGGELKLEDTKLGGLGVRMIWPNSV